MEVLDVIVSLAACETRPKWTISSTSYSIVMPNRHRIAGYTSRASRYVQVFGYLLITTLMGASCLHAATATTNDAHGTVENIASLAKAPYADRCRRPLYYGHRPHKP